MPGWIFKLIRLFLSIFFFSFSSILNPVLYPKTWVEGEGSCLLEQCWGLLPCLWQMLHQYAFVLFNVQRGVSLFFISWNSISHWSSHFLFLILCYPQRVIHKTLGALTAPLALYFLEGRIRDGTRSSVPLPEQKKGCFLFALRAGCSFSVLVTLNVPKETKWQNNCEGTVTHLRVMGCPLCPEQRKCRGQGVWSAGDRHVRRTWNHIKNSSKHLGPWFWEIRGKNIFQLFPPCGFFFFIL